MRMVDPVALRSEAGRKPRTCGASIHSAVTAEIG
jgi:hypothetical protein